MRKLSPALATILFAAFTSTTACSGDDGDDSPGGSGATGGAAGAGATGGAAGSGTGGTGGTGGSTGGAGGTGGSTGGAGGSTGGAGGATGGSAGAGGTGGAACDLTGAGKARETISGDLTASRTLTSDKVWELSGVVGVNSGVVLTVEPCTRIEGDNATLGTLLVRPGGRLEAPGTEESPILFTSDKAEGQRAPGDWGGIILLGNAVSNEGRSNIEGLTTAEPFGNDAASASNTESSGTLTWVRIEYPGIKVDANNEVNGLTLGGVGSGTTLHHVFVSNSADDCFEWFGGTVNAHHLVAYACDDDMFDMDNGFSGNLQFLFGLQAGATEQGNGFEIDNIDPTSTASPRTNPTVYNVTFCGDQETALDKRFGGIWRRATQGTYSNMLMTGFTNGALSVRDVASGTAITLQHSTFWGNGSPDTLVDSNNAADSQAAYDAGSGNANTAVTLGSCLAQDGVAPSPFPAAAITGGTPPAGLDTAATYRGAFRDAGDNWMTTPWVDWSLN